MKRLVSRKGKSVGFSLVELVIVIFIIAVLAVAIFAGGSSAIGKSRVDVVASDFHNYEVAAKSYMTENHQMLQLSLTSDRDEYKAVAFGLNEYLGTGYTINTEKPVPSVGNICNSNSGVIAFETFKKDPYGNPYVALLDPMSRNAGDSEYYVTIFSAGPNGHADVGSTLDDDDLFLLAQYRNGEVLIRSYNMANDAVDGSGHLLESGISMLSSSSGVAPMNSLSPVQLSYSVPSGLSGLSDLPSVTTTKNSKETGCKHIFEAEVITQVSAEHDGLVKYTCSVCGGSYTQTISAASNIAAFGPSSFTVTFLNEDGSTLVTKQFLSGMMPVYDGPELVKSGFVFGGWDPALKPVSGDVVYRAMYTSGEAEDIITDLTGYTWIGNSEIDLPILEQAFDLNFDIHVRIEDFAKDMFGVSGIETFSDVKGVLSNFAELAGIEDFEDNSEILDDENYVSFYYDGFNIWVYEEENAPVLAYSNNSMYYLSCDLQLLSTGTVSFCIDSNNYTMSLEDFLKEYVFVLNTSEVYRTDIGSSAFWNGDYLRPICIEGGTDATNTELIAWLQANGTIITTEDFLDYFFYM